MYYIFSIILEEGERVTSVNLPYHGPGVRLFFFSKKKLRYYYHQKTTTILRIGKEKTSFFNIL
jgi:hypothetical protein